MTSQLLSELKRTDVMGALHLASVDDLSRYTAALCHPMAYGEFGDRQFNQICETVRTQLLRAQVEAMQGQVVKLQGHVVDLHNHITDLDRKNSNLQKWVAALAVMALVAGGAQAITAILPYVGIFPSSPTASAPQLPAQQQSAPIPQAPPKVDLPNQKPPAK